MRCGPAADVGGIDACSTSEIVQRDVAGLRRERHAARRALVGAVDRRVRHVLRSGQGAELAGRGRAVGEADRHDERSGS